MIKPDQPVYAVCAISGPSNYHEEGIDLRTWMATQMMAAFISNKGYDGMQCALESVKATDALIAELNKPKP